MNRIFHTWDKWECYPAGFYDERPKNREEKRPELEKAYADFLSDEQQFRAGLEQVISEWKNSCEHYLSNECMNRIAWLGQAAACIKIGIPSAFRSGFSLLTQQQAEKANEIALEYLNKWLESKGERPVTWQEAQSKTEANLY